MKKETQATINGSNENSGTVASMIQRAKAVPAQPDYPKLPRGVVDRDEALGEPAVENDPAQIIQAERLFMELQAIREKLDAGEARISLGNLLKILTNELKEIKNKPDPENLHSIIKQLAGKKAEVGEPKKAESKTEPAPSQPVVAERYLSEQELIKTKQELFQVKARHARILGKLRMVSSLDEEIQGDNNDASGFERKSGRSMAGFDVLELKLSRLSLQIHQLEEILERNGVKFEPPESDRQGQNRRSRQPRHQRDDSQKKIAVNLDNGLPAVADDKVAVEGEKEAYHQLSQGSQNFFNDLHKLLKREESRLSPQRVRKIYEDFKTRVSRPMGQLLDQFDQLTKGQPSQRARELADFKEDIVRSYQALEQRFDQSYQQGGDRPTYHELDNFIRLLKSAEDLLSELNNKVESLKPRPTTSPNIKSFDEDLAAQRIENEGGLGNRPLITEEEQIQGKVKPMSNRLTVNIGEEQAPTRTTTKPEVDLRELEVGASLENEKAGRTALENYQILAKGIFNPALENASRFIAVMEPEDQAKYSQDIIEIKDKYAVVQDVLADYKKSAPTDIDPGKFINLTSQVQSLLVEAENLMKALAAKLSGAEQAPQTVDVKEIYLKNLAEPHNDIHKELSGLLADLSKEQQTANEVGIKLAKQEIQDLRGLVLSFSASAKDKTPAELEALRPELAKIQSDFEQKLVLASQAVADLRTAVNREKESRLIKAGDWVMTKSSTMPFMVVKLPGVDNKTFVLTSSQSNHLPQNQEYPEDQILGKVSSTEAKSAWEKLLTQTGKEENKARARAMLELFKTSPEPLITEAERAALNKSFKKGPSAPVPPAETLKPAAVENFNPIQWYNAEIVGPYNKLDDQFMALIEQAKAMPPVKQTKELLEKYQAVDEFLAQQRELVLQMADKSLNYDQQDADAFKLKRALEFDKIEQMLNEIRDLIKPKAV